MVVYPMAHPLRLCIIFLAGSHKYYSRIQGQLEIANCNECHLIVFNNKNHWEVIIVLRSGEFWSRIFPKHEWFWNKCLLPEIIDSCLIRNMLLRKPSHIVFQHRTKSVNPKN